MRACGPILALLMLLACYPAGAVDPPPPIPCPLFPTDSVWNTDISNLPVHPLSDAYIASIGAETGLHPDFGSGLYRGQPIGIPYAVVPPTQPLVRMRFRYADESDPGPYPIPRNAPIEGGPKSTGDRHVIVVETETCRLYELFKARRKKRGHLWKAMAGATWDLTSNALRPAESTSADAAGLPILPGLVRYDEVDTGAIRHALRFTTRRTQRAYLWPARHHASEETNPDVPPMGVRVRLKADVDVSGHSPTLQVILTALKRYGMFVADNGSDWYVSGVPDPRWNNDELRELNGIVGANFEAVDESGLQSEADSGAVRRR
jgi:hypothetical protein